MDKNFNADFYVTAATVIPVLYVAIAAQLPFVNRATKWLASYSWKNTREEGPKALRIMARIATGIRRPFLLRWTWYNEPLPRYPMLLAPSFARLPSIRKALPTRLTCGASAVSRHGEQARNKREPTN